MTSLAVVNPINVSPARANPVNAGAATQLAESPVATSEGLPTPTPSANAILVATPTLSSAASSVPVVNAGAPAAQGGIVLQDAAATPFATALAAEGQEVPAVELRAGDDDSAAISQMLAPLLEDQINPTPLVIALEIPQANAAPAVQPLTKEPLQQVTGKAAAFPQIMLLPTATVTPDLLKPVETGNILLNSNIPQVEIVPAVGVRYTPTPTVPPPTPTPLPQPTTPAWVNSSTGPGRLWSSFAPMPSDRNDHFWLSNPFSEAMPNTMASPNYQFGSTAGNRYRPHHGIDVSNPLGTPVAGGRERRGRTCRTG